MTTETGQISAADAGAGPTGAVLVVGGGIAGIEASVSLAESGYKVYLVEKSPSIGGTMARLDKTFPTNDCSMCILSPKLVQCGRHLNIQCVTQGEVTGVSGEAGNFHVRVKTRSRYIDASKCTGCGDCAKVCPVSFDDEFNAGLAERKAIYRPFPQAYPNAFTIDKRVRGACATACPGGINIQGFVALIGARKHKEALGVIRDSMAFPSVCGRVCHHPCEQVCKRGEYDEPLSVMALKRFVADMCGKDDLQLPPKEDPKPHRIAIIGAGPAGLSAAFELAKRGYPLDVFEALPEAGGMLIAGIPEYRLPRDVLRREIDRIEKMGVKIWTNTRLGRDITIEGLRDEGYKAILLAVGAHKPLKLDIPGEDLHGALDCVRFLRDVNLGNLVELGRRVVVVGGGNAAIDSARVARRLGDTDVTILYRRARREMPASPEEIEEAIREGIHIEYLVAPARAKSRNGRIESLTCRRMRLGAPDAGGRRRPVPIPGSEFDVPVDTLIPAISQKSELDFAPELVTTDWGFIRTEKDSSATNLPGVFACGDAVLGPSTVIDSIAAGKDAAAEIHAAFSGALRVRKKPPTDDLKSLDFPEHVKRRPRAEVRKTDVAARIANFDEVEHVLSEEAAVAEAQRCLACGVCCECLQCVAACKAGAIAHGLKNETVVLDVGAIVLAPGFQEFDASRKFAFGYSRSGNILSSMEFERILSASGPYAGHVVRPSDRKPVKRIAFIQCVGSRDRRCGNAYCSSVCCMCAVKEAVIAREHAREMEPTIFYMDIRAHGKDFDKYVERAKSEYGARFKRSRIYSMEAAPNGQVVVRYETEKGARAEETFDLGVLSVGLEPGRDFPRLAETLAVELNEDGFFRTGPLAPLDTPRPGIFVCGAASGPKDISETVVQANAAAARAGMLLAPARGALTRTRTYPPERDVSAVGPRIGVFVCHCGINIGGVVNVPSVVERARTLPNVVHAEENLYTCSQDAQDRIKALIEEKGLNRVIVASCSPRTHEPLFQETLREAGLNPHLFEMANIRDQCSWVHMNDKAAATEKARDLVRMAVAKVRTAVPLRTVLLDVNHAALVVGGGLSGMTAALSLADQGYDVALVEKTARLGGNLLRLDRTLDGDDVAAIVKDLADRVTSHQRIKLFRRSRLAAVSGFVGNYESTIATRNGKKPLETRFKHGVAVLAAGGKESRPAEYGYGKSPRVLTQLELEMKLSGGAFKAPRNVVMIQCVGSREGNRQYCSRVCCGTAIKNAIRLKKLDPDANVFVLFRDIRAYGFKERFYEEARQLGVQFLRYELDRRPAVEVRGRGPLKVRVHDTLLDRDLAIPADLVVLSSRMDPNPDNAELGALFKVALNADRFFLEAHAKLRPVDFATEGIFLCGIAHYPKDMSESIAQALAAAGRAATILSKDKIESEPRVSQVREELCAGCGACVPVCAYNAIELDAAARVARINEGVCKGCGACAATCRCGAIDARGFRDNQILDVLNVSNVEED
ncbi:MAG: FAD-dependent oxidoreductase [Verrucomicrobiota bacterium]|nr:FAD-dependent oxidoreductase [Verrucomicrobiota bacterium]